MKYMAPNLPVFLAALNIWETVGVVIVVFLVFSGLPIFQPPDGKSSSFMGLNRRHLWLLALTIAMLFLSAVYSAYRSSRSPSMIMRNQTILLGVSTALTNYHKSFGAWPENLDELITNSKNIRFLDSSTPVSDAWDQPILFSTNSTTTNGVQLRSFGADRKPGGAGADNDIEVNVRAP